MENLDKILQVLETFRKDWPFAMAIIYTGISLGLLSILVNKIIVPLIRRNGRRDEK